MSRRPQVGQPDPGRGGDGRRRMWSESPIPRVAVRRVRAMGTTSPVDPCWYSTTFGSLSPDPGNKWGPGGDTPGIDITSAVSISVRLSDWTSGGVWVSVYTQDQCDVMLAATGPDAEGWWTATTHTHCVPYASIFAYSAATLGGGDSFTMTNLRICPAGAE